MEDGTVEQFVRTLQDGNMEAACIFQNYCKTGQPMNNHAEVYCISNGVANFEVSFSRFHEIPITPSLIFMFNTESI